MNNCIKIDAMQEADLPSVLMIEKEQAFSWTEKMLKDCCLQAPYKNFVLRESDKVIGYGILRVTAGEAEVLNITVSKNRRRHGLGLLLLNHLLEIAKRHGTKEIFLEVRASNTAALKLYQGVGFLQVGMRKDYYPIVNGREDALILKKGFKVKG